MSTGRVFSLGIGAVASLTLAGFFGAQALQWSSGSETHTSHGRYDQGIRHIEVSSTNGSITLRRTAGSVVTVDRTVRESLRAARPDSHVEGDTLRLSGDCGAILFGGCSVSYVVAVPDGVSVVADAGSGSVSASGLHGRTTLAAGSGDIEAGGIRGGLVAHTGSGSIAVSDVEGSVVALRTGSGDIHAELAGADRVVAATGTGDIDLGLAQAPDRVRAHTGSGDADVVVPRGPAYDVHIRTGSGQPVYGVKQDPDSSHHIDVETGSGDAKVVYGS